MRDPVTSTKPAPSPGRLLAILGPVVFGVEFALAWLGYARDWAQALVIAAVMTPVTLLLVALLRRSPGRQSQDG